MVLIRCFGLLVGCNRGNPSPNLRYLAYDVAAFRERNPLWLALTSKPLFDFPVGDLGPPSRGFLLQEFGKLAQISSPPSLSGVQHGRGDTFSRRSEERRVG